MINITNKQDCCGCTACLSICPTGAIAMRADALGFLYPVVSKDKCIDCGLCDKVCDFNANYDKSHLISPIDIYAVRHKEMSQIEKSRSGAAFASFSDYILDGGGVVYGVGYTDHFRVVHKRATTKSERDEFRGSKYVQSDLNGSFKLVEQDLKQGLKVMFSGTPCQCAGLRSFISKKLQENLVVVDIVCDGVPSPYIFRDYIASVEKKQGKQITEFDFRNKRSFGWSAHLESYNFDKKQYSSILYTTLFYKHIMLAKGCKVCPYTNFFRPSDLTLADYWGWQRTDENFNADNKGCSLVFCNSTKGQQLFENCKKDLNYIKTNKEKCVQDNLQAPSYTHKLRDKFESDYTKKGYKYVMKHYCKTSLKMRIKTTLKKLKKILKP